MITPLPFDSKLFGYPVGKVKVSLTFDENAFLKEAEDFQLVYLFAQREQVFRSAKFLLVDTKLTLEKELNLRAKYPELQPIYSGPWEERLFGLGFESGLFSRFKLDPKFEQSEFQKLYKLWVRKAWENKEMIILNDLAGFVSSTVSAGIANYGLMAVAKEYRGKGLGELLVRSTEQKVQEEGAFRIQACTQAANIPSNQLFEKLGYKLKAKEFVYHYWES